MKSNNRYVPKHIIGMKTSDSKKSWEKTEKNITGVVISDIQEVKLKQMSKLVIKSKTGAIALIIFNTYRDNFYKINKGDNIKFLGVLFKKDKKDLDNTYKFRFFANAYNFISLTRSERTLKINNNLKSI